MLKIIQKSKLSIICILFALVLCLGGGIGTLNCNKTNSKNTIHSLNYVMPEEYTGNYIVNGNKVYAEIEECGTYADDACNNAASMVNNKTSYVILNDLPNTHDSDINLNLSFTKTGLANTFGFNAKGELNITFIKEDEQSSSNFARSVLSVCDYAETATFTKANIATTISATYNNGKVLAVVDDGDKKVEIETSGDANYTLGELVTGTSQTLNVENCVFSIGDSEQQTSNNSTLLMSASLASTATLTDTSEKNGQILKLNKGTFTLSGGKSIKEYTPKLNGETYRAGRAIDQTGGTLILENLKFTNFTTSGSGGAVKTNTGNLTVTGCEFINCQSLSEAEDTGGGAIYIGGGTATIIGGTIKNCYAAYGAAVYIAGESKLDISGNIKMQNNYATCMGGAIYSSNSTINMTSGEISNNTAGQNGGGVRLESCTGTFSGGVIGVNNSGDAIADLENYSNKANLGGGLSIASASNVEIKGTMISHNIAKTAGGIFVESGSTLTLTSGWIKNNAVTEKHGGGMTVDGVLNMNGGHVYHNAVKNSNGETEGNGGGIFVGKNGTVNLNGGLIDWNSGSAGAGIHGWEATINIAGTEIACNNSTDEAGAIFLNGGTLNLKQGSIHENSAKGNGGAIYSINATINMTGGEIGDSSRTTGATSTDFSNKSGEHGGAIYIKEGSTLNLHSGAIAHNVSMQAGGAVFSESAIDKINITDPFVAKYNKSAASGGAIYAFGVVTMSGGTLDHNSANGWGGGIIVKTAGNVFSGGTISYNSANSGAGGVCIDGDTTFDGVTIKNNQTAEHGGGIQYNSGTSVIFKSGIIENNSATKLGGGVYVGTGSFSMSGGEIKNNSSGCGGGIYAQSAVNISDGQIYNNKAQNGSGLGLEYTNMGGGLFIKGATLTITGGTIGNANVTSAATESTRSNWCSNAGGGIGCAGGATLNLNGGSISYNLAPGGGGIYSNDSTDKLNIKGVLIKYNATTDWSGGGVYSYGVINMTSGEISYNSSATVGGGLMIKTSGSNQISGGKINNNTGTSAGGGIRVDGTVTISGTTEIKNNRASEGAGISVATGVTISGGTISGNIATRGGAIHNTSSLTITGGTISGNNAETGGAIYNAGTTRISGGNITANGDATKCIIGGIYSNRALDVSGGYITNNQSSWGTQNIRIVDGTFTISGNATISTNRANVTNIYIEKGTFNLNSNFTSNNGSNSGAIGLNKNIYINVNTTLTKTYTVQKSTLTSFDDGDKASSYIAYSTNSTYLSSAKTYLSVLSLPAGRTTSITRKTNYLVMEHTRHAVDLNPILNGEEKGDGVSGVKFGIKINGVDKGYVYDFYDNQILYGSTWEIYGAQYDNTKYVISSGVPSSGTITGYISIEPEVVSLYTITFKVNNSNYGTIGGPYLGGTNLSTATFRVRHDDYDSIVIRDNIISLHYNNLVTATPKTGYRFTSWSGNTSGVIAEDRTITANFSPIFYDLWFEVNHADYGYLNWDTNGQTGSSLEYNGAHGDVFQISGSQLRTGDDELFYAVANTGYKFSHWNINGTNYTTGQFTLTGEATITAVFTQLTYIVTITSNSSVMGTVSKTTVTGVPYNTSITTAGSVLFVNGNTITTTAKTGYKFSNWSMSTNKVTSNMTITAVFVKDSITVTFRVDKYIANSYKIYYSIGGVKYYLYELVNSSGVYSVELPKSFKIGAEKLYYDESSSGETYDTLKAGTSSGSGSLGSVHPSESTNGYFEASMNITSNSNVTIYISVSRTNV